VQRKYEALEKHLKNLKLKRTPLTFSLRSPRAVLSYLGELIALQNFSKEQYVPQVLIRGGLQKMTVFRVNRGSPGSERPALSISDDYGDTYYVPRPEYGSPLRDQTLRVLAVTAELVNGAISKEDIPAPTSVVVRAIQ
jgi:hypothetical protein